MWVRFIDIGSAVRCHPLKIKLLLYVCPTQGLNLSSTGLAARLSPKVFSNLSRPEGIRPSLKYFKTVLNKGGCIFLFVLNKVGI